MCLTWASGFWVATNGYATFSYLRGDQRMLDHLKKRAEQAVRPLDELPLRYEHARLQAVAEHHGRVFPLSVAQMLLGLVLALASWASLEGHKRARDIAIQAALANVALATLAYLLLAPVRDSMNVALQQGALADLGPIEPWDQARSQQFYVAFWRWTELTRVLLVETAAPLLALFVLTRPRTRAFFDAAAEARQAAES